MHSEKNDGATFYKARRDSWFNPTMLIVGFIPLFTFGLGTWQLQRLQWKIALIDELEEKLQLEPMSLPKRIKYGPISLAANARLKSQSLSAIPEFIFRKVLVTGRWDHSRSMLLGPRVREGAAGFHVVTPLVRTDGSTILVDRGFISKDFADKYIDREEDGEVEILGMLRTSQNRNNFTPDNHPEGGTWYWADVNAMAQHAGGASAGVQPVFVEEIFGEHRINIWKSHPDEHV
jgi:surfeit locus 1 family protein